jgi:hypothetical protein
MRDGSGWLTGTISNGVAFFEILGAALPAERIAGKGTLGPTSLSEDDEAVLRLGSHPQQRRALRLVRAASG